MTEYPEQVTAILHSATGETLVGVIAYAIYRVIPSSGMEKAVEGAARIVAESVMTEGTPTALTICKMIDEVEYRYYREL